MQEKGVLTDDDIIRRIRSGESSAFGELVDRYKDKAMSLAVRLLKHEEDAEDALQEAFVKAYTSLGTFRNDSAFATWFYRIVYTTCLNTLKRKGRGQPLAEFQEDNMSGGLDSVGRESLDSEMVDRVISEALAVMHPIYASIMDLFYVQECSYDEIVSITRLPLGTVKTRLNRGRHVLRVALLQKIPDLESWLINE